MHDGMRVFFFPEKFDHALRRDSNRFSHDKAKFDCDRAQRIDWIESQLKDASLPSFRRDEDGKLRRIILDEENKYVVVVQVDRKDKTKAKFITAYVIDSGTALAKMKSNSRW
jgi:hypothetical protein